MPQTASADIMASTGESAIAADRTGGIGAWRHVTEQLLGRQAPEVLGNK